MQYEVPVGKHNNRQHASPHHEDATDVKQMPIRPIIFISIVIVIVIVVVVVVVVWCSSRLSPGANTFHNLHNLNW